MKLCFLEVYVIKTSIHHFHWTQYCCIWRRVAGFRSRFILEACNSAVYAM